jgi:fatty acid desaturase
VNYHMEHHILASCPWFRLAQAHRILRERGAVPEAPSYLEVLGIMSSAERRPVSAAG